MSEADVLIASCVAIGAMLILWKNKRQFGRLNQLGIEQFTSYRHKVAATALDVVLFSAGIGLLGAAGIVFLFEYANPFLSVLFLLFIVWVIQASLNKSKNNG